ncbi:hypothetical protein ACS0TY_011150 [Phlomoides rotata]
MASEKLGMVPPHQIHNGLNLHPQLVFPEAYICAPQQPHRRPAAAGDPGPKAATREFTACFPDRHHFFQPQPQQPPPQPPQFRHQWNTSSRSSGGDGSEDDDAEDDIDGDDEEEEEEEDDVENNMEDIVTVAKTCDSNKKDRYSTNSNSHKLKHISALGFKDGNMAQCGNEDTIDNGSNRSGELRNASGGEMCYSQYINGVEGPSSSSGQKDIQPLENGCGFRGSKEGSYLSESGESLRAILSDPLTGTLMEDAMILPCGHSFGSDGIQQIVNMKACYTCSQPVLEDSIAPNLSLRLAVQAFMREVELQVNNTSKRRRERYDMHKGIFGDSVHADQPRGKGVQFPFVVTDRVIIKGNKRTPQRFVGREAIVTTQCLNGWYVVKTLDNAESVKLQYRSLEKVTENAPSKTSPPIKTTPNWL